ncbi:MAG: hypothetical protein IJL22_00010 [Bacteroidales bacterium]|nr:hypothetical protein [Bacteroidales bacterium]
MIRAYALSGTDSEQQLHQLLVDRFGIESTAQPSAVTAAYNAHEKQGLETGRYELALAAMLPCIWIYNRVGLYILRIAKLDGNPYRDWIEAYGDESYTSEVDYMLEVIDEWAAEKDKQTRDAMTAQFLTSLQYEYDFWNYGYYGE